MTLQLNLPPELQERLLQEAERRKEPAEAVAVRLLDERLPQSHVRVNRKLIG